MWLFHREEFTTLPPLERPLFSKTPRRSWGLSTSHPPPYYPEQNATRDSGSVRTGRVPGVAQPGAGHAASKADRPLAQLVRRGLSVCTGAWCCSQGHSLASAGVYERAKTDPRTAIRHALEPSVEKDPALFTRAARAVPPG